MVGETSLKNRRITTVVYIYIYNIISFMTELGSPSWYDA